MPAAADPTFDPVRIGIVSVSDRASGGAYEDKGRPALKAPRRPPLQPRPLIGKLASIKQTGASGRLFSWTAAGRSIQIAGERPFTFTGQRRHPLPIMKS